MSDARPQKLYRAPLLIGLVIVLAIGVIAYVQVSLKRLEEGLPLRVMAEKRDMERVARNFYELLATTQAAQSLPSEENIGAVLDHLAIVESDLTNLRTRYTFDTLIGASALHATMSPTVDDVRIWLTDGFGALEPTSPILLNLVLTRIRETLSSVFDKTTEADRLAFAILEEQSANLVRLRERLVVVLAAVLLLAGGVAWLAIRQEQVSRERSEARARLQDALESTSEGFAFFDQNDRLVMANSRYRDVFLREISDVVRPGLTVGELFRAIVEKKIVIDAQKDGETWLDWRTERFRNPGGPFSLQYANGTWVQVNERKTGDGGTVVIYSDITELKKREIELLTARDAAEAASEAKSSFLANVSHELRTPLTSILGFARIVQNRLETVFPQVVSDEQAVERAIGQIRGNLEIMLIEGNRLTKLINDVLDLEKIEAGEMHWNIGPADVGEIVSQASAATQSLYQKKSLVFSAEIDPDLPPVLADRDRLVQVLVNLISNAIKFTETGSITCRASAVGPDRVSISIEDTGCGISPEDQSAIFEKFRQVGDTLTEKPTGTGLGLPICREIVEHLGGEIRVESDVGTGSRFEFWLPAAA